MVIGTGLTSISTYGWFTDPTLSDNLTPVSTFGWYYVEGGSGVIAVSVPYSIPAEYKAQIERDNNVPVESLLTQLSSLDIPVEHLQGISAFDTLRVEVLETSFVIASPQIPVENLASILTENQIPVEILAPGFVLVADKSIPIEIVGGILSDNNIPIEIIGEEQFWILDPRGVLWTIEDCGILWIRENHGNNLWNLDER